MKPGFKKQPKPNNVILVQLFSLAVGLRIIPTSEADHSPPERAKGLPKSVR